MLALLKKIVFAVVVLVLVVLGYQNAEILSKETHFVFDTYVEGYSWETPQFPVVLLYGVFFLVGLLTAGFHGVYERFARKAEIRKRDKRIRGLEAEVETMRTRLAELKPPVAEPERSAEAPARIQAPIAAEDESPTL